MLHLLLAGLILAVPGGMVLWLIYKGIVSRRLPDVDEKKPKD